MANGIANGINKTNRHQIVLNNQSNRQLLMLQAYFGNTKNGNYKSMAKVKVFEKLLDTYFQEHQAEIVTQITS